MLLRGVRPGARWDVQESLGPAADGGIGATVAAAVRLPSTTVSA
ncbi:hypothetical protein ACFWIY_00490 [Streptomyces sioyaensis]